MQTAGTLTTGLANLISGIKGGTATTRLSVLPKQSARKVLATHESHADASAQSIDEENALRQKEYEVRFN